MRKLLYCALTAVLLTGCVAVPIKEPSKYAEVTEKTEAEYAPYLEAGTGILTGQAFMRQAGGDTVRAAGNVVTLDPATSTGADWWEKTGGNYYYQDRKPASAAFVKARRQTVADADGRFRFTKLPAGKYFLRTEVTWQAPYYGTQGGLVGRPVEIKDRVETEVIVTEFTWK